MKKKCFVIGGIFAVIAFSGGFAIGKMFDFGWTGVAVTSIVIAGIFAAMVASQRC